MCVCVCVHFSNDLRLFYLLIPSSFKKKSNANFYLLIFGNISLQEDFSLIPHPNPVLKDFIVLFYSLNSKLINLVSSFSHSVVSDSLRPHELQHTRPPCPSSTPRVYSNPCSSSQWCHPAISSSVIPFSSCPQSIPASGSFPMSELFIAGGQSIGVSASTSVLPMNTRTDLL